MGKIKALLKGSVYGLSQAMSGKGMPCMGFIFQNLRTPPVRSNGGNRYNLSLGKILYRSPLFQNSANALMPQRQVFPFRRALPNGMHITGAGANQNRRNQYTMLFQKLRLFLFDKGDFSSPLQYKGFHPHFPFYYLLLLTITYYFFSYCLQLVVS